MNNNTLTFLGIDSGFGNKNTSAYFECGENITIIDCGFTVFQEVKNRFDFNKYNNINIIITHLHNDHAGSLSQLILYLWFVYNKKTTVISNCSNIKEYLDITGTSEEAYELKKDMHNLKFIKTRHVKTLDSYGFLLSNNNKNILYTGDTATIDPFLPYMNDIDELYIDVSRNGGVHIKIDDVYEVLKKIRKKGVKIIFMHMDDEEYLRGWAKNLEQN